MDEMRPWNDLPSGCMDGTAEMLATFLCFNRRRVHMTELHRKTAGKATL